MDVESLKPTISSLKSKLEDFEKHRWHEWYKKCDGLCRFADTIITRDQSRPIGDRDVELDLVRFRLDIECETTRTVDTEGNYQDRVTAVLQLDQREPVSLSLLEADGERLCSLPSTVRELQQALRAFLITKLSTPRPPDPLPDYWGSQAARYRLADLVASLRSNLMKFTDEQKQEQWLKYCQELVRLAEGVFRHDQAHIDAAELATLLHFKLIHEPRNDDPAVHDVSPELVQWQSDSFTGTNVSLPASLRDTIDNIAHNVTDIQIVLRQIESINNSYLWVSNPDVGDFVTEAEPPNSLVTCKNEILKQMKVVDDKVLAFEGKEFALPLCLRCKDLCVFADVLLFKSAGEWNELFSGGYAHELLEFTINYEPVRGGLLRRRIRGLFRRLIKITIVYKPPHRKPMVFEAPRFLLPNIYDLIDGVGGLQAAIHQYVTARQAFKKHLELVAASARYAKAATPRHAADSAQANRPETPREAVSEVPQQAPSPNGSRDGFGPIELSQPFAHRGMSYGTYVYGPGIDVEQVYDGWIEWGTATWRFTTCTVKLGPRTNPKDKADVQTVPALQMKGCTIPLDLPADVRAVTLFVRNPQGQLATAPLQIDA